MTTATDTASARNFGAVKVGQNGRSLQFAFVDVSPDLAESWLLLEHPDNRHSAKTVVNDYRTSMDADRWNCLTGESLKFDTQGRLIDGGHRLRGVLQHGKTVTMLVCWGCPPEAIHLLDQGRSRNRLWWEDKNVAAVAQILLKQKDGGYSTHRATRVALERVVNAHRAAIRFSCDLFPSNVKGIATAQTRAVVARASYYEDPRPAH